MSSPTACATPEAAAPVASSKSNPRLLLLLVFVLALALRLQFIAVTEFGTTIRGDATANVSYAYNLVNKRVFSSARPDAALAPADSYRGPGYPVFLAPMVAAAGDSLAWMGWVRCLQALLGALTVILTAVLARRMMPPLAVVGCALLVAMWPHLITSSGFFLTETLAGFALLLAMVASERAVDVRTPTLLLVAGLLWGLAYAVNPVFFFAPLIYLPRLVGRNRNRLTVLFVIAAMALPAAWAVRNASLPRQVASSGSRAMSNFVQGSWPQYHAAYASRDADEEPARILGEIGAEDTLLQANRRAGLQAIYSRMSKDPLRYAFWYLAYKPFLLWDWSIRIGYGDIYAHDVANSPFERPGLLAGIKRIAMAINPWILMAAAGYALMTLTAVARRRADGNETISTVVLMVCYLTLVHVVLQAEPRYSIPYRPLEFMLAVLAMHFLAQRWRRFREVRATTRALRVDG